MYELRGLFEQAVGKLAAEDLKRDRELVRTLEVYCETVSTQRLAVHRNTVLYRLRQIEEITSFDVEDGPTRLLLQLGLLAGRLVRQRDAQSPQGSALIHRAASDLSRRAG